MTSPVLIAGAGPTGLVLALSLTRQGIPVRIIEKHDGPGQASRAMAVQARTLEFYRQLGIDQPVIDQGLKMERLRLRQGQQTLATVNFGDFGQELSPFPYALSYPQDDHEKLLVDVLSRSGVQVEWRTELLGFTQDGDRVTAQVRRDGVDETLVAAWLCGCDGAHSAVRKGLGIGFPGGTYEARFFVTDLEAAWGGDADAISVNLGAAADGFRFLAALFPVRRAGMVRVIGLVPAALSDKAELVYEDLQEHLKTRLGLEVSGVNWFSSYRVHHRVAERFQAGRTFLLGDAAHVHSPAGGQGMNTGIGDAVNLAWKLAQVWCGRMSPAVLDTYEVERQAFARVLVSTTDRMFEGMAGTGWNARFFRRYIVRYVMPLLFGFGRVRRLQFSFISQLRIEYRHSPLSHGAAGHVHGGDRLPWVPDNFAPLSSFEWQAHVYGTVQPELRRFLESVSVSLHVFDWDGAADRAGLKQHALYLVRPDGYVSLAAGDQDVPAVIRWMDDVGFITM